MNNQLQQKQDMRDPILEKNNMNISANGTTTDLAFFTGCTFDSFLKFSVSNSVNILLVYVELYIRI